MGGAIIGQCPVCKDFIYESDDWTVTKFYLKHRECDAKVMDDVTIKITRMSKEQKYRILNFLEKELEE